MPSRRYRGRKEATKRKKQYLKSLRCLEVIKSAEESGIALRNASASREKHESIVQKYLEDTRRNPAKYRKGPKPELEFKKIKHYFSNLRDFHEVITDPLCLTIVKDQDSLEPVRIEWPEVESDLMELVTAHNLANKNGPTPRYDTKEIHRGYRVIKCADEFSKYFMYEIIHLIYDKWKDLKLKLLPAQEIPRVRLKKYPCVPRLTLEETKPPPSTKPRSSTKPLSEIITDPLCLAVAGEREGFDAPVQYEWPSIESELVEFVANYNRTNENGPELSYDATDVYHRFRLIKCINEFSKEMITGWFNRISEKYGKIGLKVIPASTIPKKRKKPIDVTKIQGSGNDHNEPSNHKSFKVTNEPVSQNFSTLPQTFKPSNTDDVEAPQTSNESLLQNAQTYKNPFRQKGIYLSGDRMDSYRQHKEIRENSQQEYSQVSSPSNYLDSGKEINTFEKPKSEGQGTHSADWRKPSDHCYGNPGTNLKENYEDPPHGNKYIKPKVSFNNANKNFNTDLPQKETDYNRFSPRPSILERIIPHKKAYNKRSPCPSLELIVPHEEANYNRFSPGTSNLERMIPREEAHYNRFSPTPSNLECKMPREESHHTRFSPRPSILERIIPRKEAYNKRSPCPSLERMVPHEEANYNRFSPGTSNLEPMIPREEAYCNRFSPSPSLERMIPREEAHYNRLSQSPSNLERIIPREEEHYNRFSPSPSNSERMIPREEAHYNRFSPRPSNLEGMISREESHYNRFSPSPSNLEHTFPREDTYYNRFSPGPSNSECNYRPRYEDTTFSMHSPPKYTQGYFLENQSQNFFPYNDETPPPPQRPRFKTSDDSIERSRDRRRRRRY